MIVHVNFTKQNQIEKSKETEIPKYKSLLDEYDDSGNYIGDDPKLMESDYQESECKCISLQFVHTILKILHKLLKILRGCTIVRP